MGSPPQSSATRDASRNGQDAGQPSLVTAATAEADLELLSRFEPVLRLTAGELFRPGGSRTTSRTRSLVVHRGREVEVVAEPGSLTPDGLARLGARSTGVGGVAAVRRPPDEGVRAAGVATGAQHRRVHA